MKTFLLKLVLALGLIAPAAVAQVTPSSEDQILVFAEPALSIHRNSPERSSRQLYLRDNLAFILLRFNVAAHKDVKIRRTVLTARIITTDPLSGNGQKSPAGPWPAEIEVLPVLTNWGDKASFSAPTPGASWIKQSGFSFGLGGDHGPSLGIVTATPAKRGDNFELDVTELVRGWMRQPATNRGLMLRILNRPTASVQANFDTSPLGMPRIVIDPEPR